MSEVPPLFALAVTCWAYLLSEYAYRIVYGNSAPLWFRRAIYSAGLVLSILAIGSLLAGGGR